jgi:hypothetical protein
VKTCIQQAALADLRRGFHFYERQPTNLTLSTLEKVARAMGRKLVVKLA